MIELNSLTWRTVCEHCEAALAHARDELESLATDERRRFIAAVRVNVLKDLLALGEPRHEENGETGPANPFDG